MDLFDYMRTNTMKSEAPLASRMRPETLEEIVGQQHIIGKDKLLYRAIRADKLGSVIFYGPPGTGKTTIAKVIAHTTKAEFTQINATVAGKKDMEDVVRQAKDNLGMYGKHTILFVVGDEIVIEDYRDYYVGDKEEVFSQLREKLPNNPVYVKFNDDILGFDEPPIIEDGSTLVPMRFLFEQMGADVEWDSETQTATATLDNKAVTFSIDNVNARINNKPAKMDVPARLVNGKTMVPLRFLSENMGYDVDWDADSRTAIVR